MWPFVGGKCHLQGAVSTWFMKHGFNDMDPLKKAWRSINLPGIIEQLLGDPFSLKGKELPSLQVTQNRQWSWKQNANKSSVIDITPPKNLFNIHWKFAGCGKTIDSFWNCPFPGDMLIFGWGYTIWWLQLAIFGWDEMSYGLHLHFWLPVDLLLTVWPTSHRIQTTPENPGVFWEFVLILDLLGQRCLENVPKIDSSSNLNGDGIRWYNP